jgi:hypothetical protein
MLQRAQDPLRLTPKIGTEEKAADWLSPECPVSVAIGMAARLRQPDDSDLSDIPRISCYDERSPARRGISDGATTSQATPIEASSRCSSKPHGPAS